MNKSCDCIIPFYNECTRVIRVVEEVSKVKNISKIVIVDDGSHDNAVFLQIQSQFPQIISIRLEKNTGKANAIKEGLKHVTGDYVLFVDGDLANVQPSELENAIWKIINNHKIDMIILPLVTDIMKHDPFRLYTIFSGQRILKKQDLEIIYQKQFSNFQLEAMINQYMIDRHKNVFWTPSSIHNLSKYKKWGVWEGIKRVYSLYKEVSKCIGWRNFIYQILFFCKQKAP